jgi:hypothetical protein
MKAATIHFVGGHSVKTDWSANEIIDACGTGALHEPAMIMISLDDGHRLHFNPVHVACIEEHTTAT